MSSFGAQTHICDIKHQDGPKTYGNERRGKTLMITRAGQLPDLGHEPPLNASGSNAEVIDRREVSLRWLGASILVGITGGALIGASVYIAFQGLTSLVEQPRKARNLSYYAQYEDGKTAGAISKGDRLFRQTDSAAENKDGIRIPVTIRVGDREIIKVRQFMRISTVLSPTAGLYATNIPPFNPAKLMSEGSDPLPVPEQPPIEVADADVSFTKADLTRIAFQENQQTLSDSDALAQLEAERSMLLQRGQRSGLPISPQFLLSRPLPNLGQLPDITGQAPTGDGLFSGIEVRVIPENVTSIVKGDSAESEDTEEEFSLKKGETLQAFLASKGADTDQIDAIVATLERSVKVSSLGEGQKIRLLIGPVMGPSSPEHILRVSLHGGKSATAMAIAAMTDRGQYVSVLPQDDSTTDTNQTTLMADNRRTDASSGGAEEDGSNEKLGTARIYDSLYETAAKNSMPDGTVEDLVRIFSSDVDFQRRVSPSDLIEVLYSVDEDNGDKPEMLFAAFSTGGETRKLYRYQGEDGNVDYLDGQGRSLKRFLMRKPITDAVLRSGFGMRRHPILRYSKMHTGVDWANKIGTPILAAGNGTIVMAGWKSGYGQRIEIQHANGYVTSYSHQSRFAAGSVVGAKVRQGQVIGYVGNTGLSTGPHLHYEVMVNGHLVDPMKIRVPRGRELDGAALAEFKRQREQVDEILEKTGSTIALAQSSSD